MFFSLQDLSYFNIPFVSECKYVKIFNFRTTLKIASVLGPIIDDVN